MRRTGSDALPNTFAVRLYSAEWGRSRPAPSSPATGSRRSSGGAGWASSTAARQIGLERMVALKVIAPELLDDEDVRAALPGRGAGGGERRPPERDPGLRGGRGRRGRVHRDALRRPASDLRSLVRGGGALDPAEAADDRRAGRSGAGRDPPRRASSTATSSPRTCSSTRSGHVYLTDFGLAKQVLTRTGRDTHRPVGRDARLRRAGADPRRAHRRARRRLRARRRAALRADRAGAVRARGRRGEAVGAAVRAAAGAVRAAARAARRTSTPSWRGRWPRSRRSATRRRATSAARRWPPCAGTVPTEPERVVARGAAAPGAAPTEPGLAAEASTRTAATRRGAPPAARDARSAHAAAARRRRARATRRAAGRRPRRRWARSGRRRGPPGRPAGRRSSLGSPPRSSRRRSRVLWSRSATTRCHAYADRERHAATSPGVKTIEDVSDRPTGSCSRAATCGCPVARRRGSPASTRRPAPSATTIRRSGAT